MKMECVGLQTQSCMSPVKFAFYFLTKFRFSSHVIIHYNWTANQCSVLPTESDIIQHIGVVKRQSKINNKFNTKLYQHGTHHKEPSLEYETGLRTLLLDKGFWPMPSKFQKCFLHQKKNVLYTYALTHGDTHSVFFFLSLLVFLLSPVFGLFPSPGSDPKMHHNFKCYSQMGQTTGCVLLLISHSWHDHVCLSHSSKKWRNHTYKCSQKDQPGHLCKQDLVTRYTACGELMWVCDLFVSPMTICHTVLRILAASEKTVWISSEHKSRHALPG